MALIVISVDRSSLPSHTDDQFEEWVEFNVGHRGGLSEDNPSLTSTWKRGFERLASKRKLESKR